jgi:hypothetical protein
MFLYVYMACELSGTHKMDTKKWRDIFSPSKIGFHTSVPIADYSVMRFYIKNFMVYPHVRLTVNLAKEHFSVARGFSSWNDTAGNAGKASGTPRPKSKSCLNRYFTCNAHERFASSGKPAKN